MNFETSGPGEVEVAKADGTAIRKATVHPVRYGKSVYLKDGKSFLTLDKPCLVAVDIDGTMCDQDTTRTPDGGPGVSERDLTQIFDPFCRVEASRDHATGGVGLGLAIVKICVESCGGIVTARNRASSGLEIAIKLPAARPPAPSS